MPSRRCSKPIFSAFFNFSHKRPTFAFTSESGHTLGSRRKIAHNGSHAETGGLPFCEHSVALRCQRNTFYSTVLLYTYISRFSVNPHYQQKRNIRQSCRHKFYPQPLFIVFFNFLHKRPTFAFTSESGHTLGSRRKIAHNGSHGETRGVSDGGAITTLGAFHTFRKPCVARCQNGKLCRFWGLDLVYSRRTQRACGTAMRSCASLFRGVAAPPGCVIFFASAEIAVCTSGAHDFPRVQGGERYHYPRCALHVLETLDGRLSKRLVCRFLRSMGIAPRATPIFLRIYRYPCR